MMKKKDVLILCQFFYPEYVSSATLPFEMARGFVKEGMEVDVICGYPKEYALGKVVHKKEVVEGVGITRIKYIQLDSKKKLTRLVNFLSFLVSMTTKIMKLRKYKNVIVYSNPPVLPIIPALTKKLFGFNLVFVAYDIYPEVAILLGAIQEGSAIDKITNKVNKVLYKNTTKIVALSQEMKEYIIKNKPYITDEKVEVIPNWYTDKLELQDMKICNQKFKNLKASGKTIVLYSGNMGMAQDMDTIINTAKQLKDDKNIHFMLVGHGCKLNDLRVQIEKESLDNIEVYEFLHGTEFTDVLKIADAYIISLEKGIEALSVPSKTYSYMSVGRPLLAIMSETTDIAKDICDNNIGFVIEQGNIEKMIESIKIIKEDKQLVEEMSKRCRRVYEEKYTDKICINKYIEMINKL
ncbi:MAG: glycosyltransferase family 4 protein [Cellulosilyticaceae bacterium]